MHEKTFWIKRSKDHLEPLDLLDLLELLDHLEDQPKDGLLQDAS